MSSATRFRGRSRLNSEPRAVAAIAVMVGFVCIAMRLPIVFMATILPTIALALIPTRITVGNDGVRIAWLGSRFFPYRDVAGVHDDGQDVWLELEGGRSVLLPIASKNRLVGNSAKRTALVQRLLSARAAYARTLGANHDVLPRLDVLGHDDGSAYRAAPIEPDGLWRVVENPAVETHYRVAAVNALTPTLDDAGRKRVAEVAEASASDETRSALRRASQPKEDD